MEHGLKFYARHHRLWDAGTDVYNWYYKSFRKEDQKASTSKNSVLCENQGRVHLGAFDFLGIAHFRHLARNFRMSDPHSKIYIMGEV
jgi:hypothetical protein